LTHKQRKIPSNSSITWNIYLDNIRQLHKLLLEPLGYFPAVALLGPRQCGKTTLARTVVDEMAGRAIYLDLERAEDVALLADPGVFLRSQRGKLVVMDEVQRAPELFVSLRSEIDERRRAGQKAGQFLLLGSASRELLAQSSESLAGRIDYLELTPFRVDEVTDLQRESLWLRGGFPDSLLAPSDTLSFAWRRAYLTQVIERDVAFFAPRLPGPTLRRLWAMIAVEQGGLLNAAKLAQNLAVSGQSITRYLALLVELMHLRALPPWHGNIGKRLTKSPKYFVRDSGLLHALLEIHDEAQLLRHPVIGQSFEGFVIEQICNLLGPEWRYSFYRTQNGAEIDLIAERGTDVLAVEIKRSSKPVPSRGFYSGSADIGATHCLLVHAGERSWTLDNELNSQTRAVPVDGLVESLRSFSP
jgi:uncharacterized protein